MAECVDERAIAALAAAQRGVVTAEQLCAAGFTRAKIKRRLRAGMLRCIHRNVYMIGYAPAMDGAAELAATLACGDDSAISHRSGGRLWQLSACSGWHGAVEISAAGRRAGHKAGLRIYRDDSLDSRDMRILDGIRVTSPARTLLDLVSVLPLGDVEAAMAEARARGLVKDRELVQLLARSRGRRGVTSFRRLVELTQTGGLTRSEAERLLKALLRAAGLPTPKTNVRLLGYEVDFLWSEQRVIVEVDGFAFHAGRTAFERDRMRDAALHAHGYAVIRITWQQLATRPEEVVALIAGTLAVRSVQLRDTET